MGTKKIKGVLFDFNGTLFFDTDCHVKAFEQYYAKCGMEVPSAEYIINNLFGLSREPLKNDRFFIRIFYTFLQNTLCWNCSIKSETNTKKSLSSGIQSLCPAF